MRDNRRLALSGIMLALAVITVFLASVLPTSRLSLYALSSFYIAVIIMEAGIKAGWTFYAASCLLTAIIVPNKLGVIPFALFFGIYGIIKLYVEKIHRLFPEYIIKLAYFNLCLGINLFFIKQFFLDRIELNFPWWVVILGLELIFIIYDYVYTLFIQYYREKLKKFLRI